MRGFLGLEKIIVPALPKHSCESRHSLLWRWIGDLSRMSYGMYLAHIIALNAIHARVAPIIGNAFVRIPATHSPLFSLLISGLLSLLPGSKYLIG